ncbi:MAG: hypothetical protein AMS21_01150 [Gemmatimonas sp. SG8_38_2]|nr:MAG: hypothetical protein AMS21_01150 [Gemmatimonas sp. SG8_38_2]
MKFNLLKEAIRAQFERMAQHALYLTDVTKDDLWETYLSSFPNGSNPIYRERTEHDCNCCRSFIKACGNVVTVVGNKMTSIWDVEVDEPNYQAVVDGMAALVKSRPIRTRFVRTEKTLGTDKNHKLEENGDVKVWEHFHFELPRVFVVPSSTIGSYLSESTALAQVFARSLAEIPAGVVETVLELIDQNSIYRGEEHRSALETFLEQVHKFKGLKTDEERDCFVWGVSGVIGPVARIRNTAIGTLLVALSEGQELDKAVTAFERIVAPTNYKRPKALVTKTMIRRAQQKVEELGLTSALQRRHAVIDDITINNVIFADRTAKKAMNVFDAMASEVGDDPKKYSKVEEVHIDEFVGKILPKAKSIELQMENRHEANLMSLIAPVNDDVERLFKWHNNFSWAYHGEVADSVMKDLVKAHGGNVSGILRFSIMWNDRPVGENQNDFDAHCEEPNGNHIWYPTAGIIQPSSGILDVDIIIPGDKPAVENITWGNQKKMREGKYKFWVNNFNHQGGLSGFTAEIEYGGVIHTFVYNRELRHKENVTVAELNYSKANGITFIKALPSTTATLEIWGLSTNRFHRVSVIMKSPNHWDGKETGNRHWFFILDGCKNPKSARGYFNEFLRNDLNEHRKVFEILGSKMRAEVSDNQLSGLGFSSTKRNSVLCRVTGKTTRVIRINF